MAIDWSSFLPTILATFLGVGLAFWLNHLYDNKLERIKARRLLFLLKEDIEFNIGLLHELKKWLPDSKSVVFFNLNFVIWNSLPSNIIPFLKKPKIVTEISKFYYQLQHVSRKVDMLFNLCFGSNLTKETEEKREHLVKSINDHVSSILQGEICKSPLSIIPEIDCLIDKLK
jgi:hypothetical protein